MEQNGLVKGKLTKLKVMFFSLFPSYPHIILSYKVKTKGMGNIQ